MDYRNCTGCYPNYLYSDKSYYKEEIKAINSNLTVQNKMHWAAHGVADEILYAKENGKELIFHSRQS